MAKLLRRSPLTLKRWTGFSRGIGCKLGLLTLAILLSAACGKFFPSATSLVAISISPNNSTLTLSSKTQQFSATGTFGDSSSKDITSSVTWSSSSTNVATISSSGLATAGSTGSTTITASESGITGTTNLTVSNQATGLTVSPSSQTITAGQSFQFSATQNGSTVSGVTWNSSNPAVASIDQTGLATGITTGTVTITATATINGTQQQGTATLTVQ
jgi:trimeric autotransporter adhesin